jgi:hypothetical protein
MHTSDHELGPRESKKNNETRLGKSFKKANENSPEILKALCAFRSSGAFEALGAFKATGAFSFYNTHMNGIRRTKSFVCNCSHEIKQSQKATRSVKLHFFVQLD